MPLPPAPLARSLLAHCEPYNPGLHILDPLTASEGAWVLTLYEDLDARAMILMYGPTEALLTSAAATVIAREALARGSALHPELPHLPGLTADTVLRSRCGSVSTPYGAVTIRVCTSTRFAEFDADDADVQRWSRWVLSPWDIDAGTEDPLESVIRAHAQSARARPALARKDA